ncbi:MAG: hypothetical protein ACJ72X_05470 [Nitrososphaeraceae archaeon]
MTFKDLKKRVSLQVSQEETRLFERLKGKPFWIWNIEEHKQEDANTDGDCCFNHIIGLPTKEGMEKAMFDYEKILYDSIFSVNDSTHSFFRVALKFYQFQERTD